MSRFLMLSSLMLLSLVVACTSSESVPVPTNSELVSGAKQSVLDFVASAKKSPKQAKAEGMVLYESLDPLEDPALTDLKATAKTLSEQYASNADTAEISQTIDKLQQQAEQL